MFGVRSAIHNAPMTGQVFDVSVRVLALNAARVLEYVTDVNCQIMFGLSVRRCIM